MDNKNYKYDFFISYKHGELDSEIASYLQQLLEHYKIPKDIQQKSKKTKISRVFRDESELSASSDLSKDIEEQLANSEFLIVICSPDTKNSRWVDQEIRTFIKLRDRRNILPVLIKGEPEDSFPDALMETEPMAADFRSTDMNLIKKRCRSELLRLVSPALYCSYDELKQRHKAYQFRKLAITASVITVLAILFSTYSIYQNIQIQKNYQEKQINQSKLLADKSEQLLAEEGDRESALLIAMEALPDSEADTSTPLVGEAQLALEDALSLYSLPDQDGYTANRILQMQNVSNLDYSLSEEDRVLATIDNENIIYFWDLDTETLITSYSVSTDIYSLEVHMGTDGRAYICHSDEVICYNYRDNITEWAINLQEEDANYKHFALSPQKDILFCAGNLYDFNETSENHNTISWLFFDTATGELLQRNQSSAYYGRFCTIKNLGWSPDNNTIYIEYSYLQDETSILIADYATGSSNILAVLPQDEYAVTLCSFLDNNTLIYLWGSSGSMSLNMIYETTEYFVSAFDIQSSTKLWEVKTSASARDTYPQIQTSEILDYSDDIKTLITVTAFSKVINIIDGQIVSETSYPNEIAGVFTEDRKQFHLTDDGILHWINALDGAAFNEFYGKSDLGVEEIMIARSYSDSEIFLLQQNSNNVYLLNQAYDESGIVLENSSEVATNACYDSSGNFILGLARDYDNDKEQIFLWDNSTGAEIFTDTINLDYIESSFNPGFIGEKYFYYATDKRILIYSLETKELLTSYYIEDNDLCSGTIDKIEICNSDAPNMFFITSHADIVQLTGEQLEPTLIASQDNLEYLFDPEEQDDNDSSDYTTYYSYNFYASPNGRYLVFHRYVYSDSTVLCPIAILDLTEQAFLDIPSITLYPDTTLTNLVFSEDSTRIMVYNADQKLQIIDLESQSEVLSLDFAGGTYHYFWFSPDNRYLFLHTNDHLLKIYDSKNNEYIMNSDDEPYTITKYKFYEKGQYLLIQSKTTMSYPICTLYYKTDTGAYEAFSNQRACVDATLQHYLVGSSSSSIYIYKRPSLDEMLEMAKDYLNGRELTDLERQKFHIEE